jgi:hypothetical protein
LEYINDEQYKWTTCIGTPYGTNKWQVGDSLQQDGSFKMEIGKGKMSLLKEKTKIGHKFELTKKGNCVVAMYCVAKVMWLCQHKQSSNM